MPMDPLLVRARGLWEGLASAPVAFPPAGGADVVVSPRSGLCPGGWVGVVSLGGAAVVTAPDGGTAAAVRSAFEGLAVEALTDADAVRAVLPVVRLLGPAALAYASAEGFRPAAAGSPTVERLPGDHPELRALERAAGADEAGEAGLDEITSPAFVVRADEAGEAGLDEITSPAFVVRAGTRVVAAAGYRTWPGRTAHIGVLTAPGSRGRGLARVTGSAATSHALAAGLLPQWRARPPESRRVAAALGFRELGAQLSIELV